MVPPMKFQNMSADDLKRRSRLLDNEIRVLKDESTRLGLEQQGLTEKIKENKEKIKLSNQLPYLVGNVVEILDVSPDDEEVGSAHTQIMYEAAQTPHCHFSHAAGAQAPQRQCTF